MVKLKMSSNLLKWTSTGAKLSRSASQNQQKKSPVPRVPNTKDWVHDESMLVSGHVAYRVKFLGNIEVDQPKGLDTVRESIKKLEFLEHLKRSEGEKIKRIELTISVGGVAIREPKTKNNIFQFPLHRISYCADDKSIRKYLSFICKVQENSDRHECFVFVCDKLSEEIALTIGQAFDLAWRRFLDPSMSDFDAKRELVLAKRRILELEKKVSELENKLKEGEKGTLLPNPNTSQTSKKASILPTNQMIDLTPATNILQPLIDLP